jgi:outer membrane protein
VDLTRIGGTTASTSASPSSLRPYASTLVGAGVNQEVFDFGRIAAQSAAADALVDVARHSADTERLDTDFAVEEAYFAVYAAKAIVVASDDAYARAVVHHGLAKAGVDAGLRSPIEETRAEADLARFDVGRVRAAAGVTIAETLLAAAVGVPEPALDVSAAAPGTSEMPSLAAAIRAAAERDPQILEVQARLRAQEGATKAIGAQLRPDVSLTSTLSIRAGGAPGSGTGDVPVGSGFLPDVPNWDVGVILSWPVWSGPVVARQRASKVREQVERENLSLVRFQRATAIQEAYVRVSVARTALPALQRSVDAAHANYAQAEARFNAGLGNSVELADAEALRTQAEIDLAIGQFELARSRVAFGRAIAEEL